MVIAIKKLIIKNEIYISLLDDFIFVKECVVRLENLDDSRHVRLDDDDVEI